MKIRVKREEKSEKRKEKVTQLSQVMSNLKISPVGAAEHRQVVKRSETPVNKIPHTSQAL